MNKDYARRVSRKTLCDGWDTKVYSARSKTLK